MNPGIENIRKKGSRIVAEGAHMLPAASLMMAAGVIDSWMTCRSLSSRSSIRLPIRFPATPPGSNRRHRVRGIKGAGFQRLVRQRRRRHLRWHRHGHSNEVLAASRELIADEIETIIGAHPCDAWIGSPTATRSFRHVQRHGAHQHPSRLPERRADAGRRGQHGPDHRVRSGWQA